MDFAQTTVKNWNELFEVYKGFETKTQWVFRGLPDASYQLETTLERVAKGFEVGLNKLIDLEPKMIRLFKRQAHRYLENPPEDDETLQWLALMQHFGSPTRLLDWTYSFFVALFFAMEKAKARCAVWAIDMDWIIKRAESLRKDDFDILREEDRLLKSGYFFKLIFDKRPPIALVYSLNPERLNERLIVQQGLFLAPGDISKPFKENLDAICKTDSATRNYVRKIIIDADVGSKCDILRYLHRMNINRASLFPGLSGFAESLAMYLANPDLLGKID